MIGILGAYGYVGIFATRFLSKFSNQALRIGGRDFSKVPEEIQKEFSSAEWMQVDAARENELEAFFTGCDCILDATSLPDKSVLALDAMAEKLHIPLVHLGINGFERKKSCVPLIYGAGSIPGLSGLLPQYLAKSFESVKELNFCFGGNGTMSKSAAKDYLEGICDPNNHSMVYWNQGRIEPFTPSFETNEFFDSQLSDYRQFPYFDEESEAIAHKLQVHTGRWQMCIPGKRVLAELDKARGHYKQDPQRTIEDLCLASQLDMFGKKEDALFYCSITGIIDGVEKKKILTLSGTAPRENTGETAAAAVIAVLNQGAPLQKQLLGESNLYESVISILQQDARNTLEIRTPDDEAEGEI